MTKRAPWLWPLLLMIGGVVLLLNNFLLIDLDLAPYWPVVLVLVGLQVLLRGDIALTWQAHTFGITRGSVQSAAIEIESGELDVQVRTLYKPGRLIAGQYTARSRPDLHVRNNHAVLRMQRGHTWWLSLADWEVGLASDLPWSLLISSHLGQLEVDLHDVQVERAYVCSGLGNVELTCPRRAAGPLLARSTFGDVRVDLPERSRARLRVQRGPFGRVRVNHARFAQIGPDQYVTRHTDDDPGAAAYDLDITVGTVFGSISVG